MLRICSKYWSQHDKARVVVNDLMQHGFVYYVTEPAGQAFHRDFRPELTPKEMLELGVFGGKYMTDCTEEFPVDWLENAKLCHERHDPIQNYFGVNASQPLSVWRKRVGSTAKIREAGFSGTVATSWVDDVPTTSQIKRWVAVRRHAAQIKKHCRRGDMQCRPKQRQALLHWAYDSRKL